MDTLRWPNLVWWFRSTAYNRICISESNYTASNYMALYFRFTFVLPSKLGFIWKTLWNELILFLLRCQCHSPPNQNRHHQKHVCHFSSVTLQLISTACMCDTKVFIWSWCSSAYTMTTTDTATIESVRLENITDQRELNAVFNTEFRHFTFFIVLHFIFTISIASCDKWNCIKKTGW